VESGNGFVAPAIAMAAAEREELAISGALYEDIPDLIDG